MVKKSVYLLLMLVLILPFLCTFSQPSKASTFEELIIGMSPDNAGKLIASRGSWKLIEFWHYSGGYWKATTTTENGIKEIVIYDNEAYSQNFTDINFLVDKIYKNEFVLEYKIYHPREVLDALAAGATITPVMSIDTETLRNSYNEIIPTKYFNFEPLPSDLPNELPEKPEYTMCDNYMIIRALPKLNCERRLTIQDKLEFFYPHPIPLVKTGFGSLGYAMFHHDGSVAGEAYSPDPFYGDRNNIQYTDIADISGRLRPGFLVTTKDTQEGRVDEESDNLRIGYGTFANAGAVSIRFWYPIRIDYYAVFPATVTPTVTPTPTPSATPIPTPPEPPPAETVSETLTPVKDSSMDEDSVVKIAADDRGNEKFNVNTGIPVRENLYVNIKTKEYLYDLTFTEHTHSESETIRVKKTYHLTWKEDRGYYESNQCGSGKFYHVRGRYCEDSDGDGIKDYCPGHSYTGCRDTNGDGINDYCPGHKSWVSNWVDMHDTQTVYSAPYTVNRKYSYWTVDHFEAFVADKVTVENAALPGGSITISQQGIPVPQINLSHNGNISAHVLNNPFSDAISSGTIVYDSGIGSYVIDLGSESKDGGTSRPSVPSIVNPGLIIENSIEQYKTKNDLLIFNGTKIMDNVISADGNTPDPLTIPQSRLCHEDVFYKNSLTIPDHTLNGIHESSGSIVYRRLPEAVNPVKTDTLEIPISSVNSVRVHTPVVCNSGVLDDVNNDQTLNPDRSRSALVLGRPSRIRVLTVGEHLDIKGYNNAEGLMDCRKYTKDRQVRFPFDVYIGTDKPENSYFVPENTWHSIPLDSTYDDMYIYIPTWVPEGDYEVEFRQIAVNAPDLSGTENLANLDINNYIAVRKSPVRVIGRIYGFKITDIADKLWQDVFRSDKNTLEHTGNYYFVGTKDEEGKERGINQLFTLPILEGSHALYKNRGALKTGYTFRFDLTTVGEYYRNEDYINIEPEFYYVKKDGSGRQKVDLWYHEEFNGRMNYFVKIESTGRNRDNQKNMKLGDIYRNIPDDEILYAAQVLGINENSFRNKLSKIGWFDQIILSKEQRTFVGQVYSLPEGVHADRVRKSVQKWYGEYYLPNDVFATPVGFDVAEYGRKNNGLTGKESFWLKDGYIIVNFKIETVKNDDFNNPVLSYWKAPYCNMFEQEGFSYTKTDYYGATFQLMDGDIVFYDTNKRSSDDYRTGGTH